jgi:hypothetical protein
MEVDVKKPIVLHPLFIALFPVLTVYSHNISQMVSVETDIFMPMLLIILSAVIIWGILWLALKNGQKAAMVTSLLLFMFFSYGYFVEILSRHFYPITIRGVFIGYNKLLLPPWTFLLAAGAILLIRMKRNLNNATVILNVAAFSLIAVTAVGIVAYKAEHRDISKTGKSHISGGSAVVGREKSKKYRDIYYIILDEYANLNTMKNILKYDNSEFVDYLKGKGFHVDPKSRSNYPFTYSSLSSSLNMTHLTTLKEITENKNKQDYSVFYKMIEDNEVKDFLKSKGYKFVFFSSDFTITKTNKYADRVVQCDWGNEFLLVMLESTMLYPFEKDYLAPQERRKHIPCVFSELAKIPEEDGPVFAFAHMVLPHPSYVFDENGDMPSQAGQEIWTEREKEKMYIGQVKYTNRMVKDLVDKILSRSKIPPIIILQGDHGTRLTMHSFRTSTWTEKNIQARMGILNAYYLPGGGDKMLYDSITPVNTFRVIFNYYFHANFSLLDDTSYMPGDNTLMNYTNITDEAGGL